MPLSNSSIAPTTGLANYMPAGHSGQGPLRAPYSAPAAMALRPKPAQKVPPAPVRTATERLSSIPKVEKKVSRRAAAVSGSTAFRTPGRSMVTVSTAPSTSVLTFLECASLVVVFHERVAMVGRRHVRLFDDAGAYPSEQVQERAGLVVGARSAGTAEGLESHDRTCRLVVDVEIARRVDELLRGFANRLPVTRKHRTCQAIRARAVAEVERLVELSIRVGVSRQDGAEQLLAQELEIRVGRLDDRRPDEPPDLIVPLAARDDLGRVRLLGVLDRAHVVAVGALVDHRAHEVAEVGDIALGDRLNQVDQVGFHRVPHRLRDVRTRRGGAFLSLGLEGSAHQCRAQRVRVRGVMSDDEILAARLPDQPRVGAVAGDVLTDLAPH